MVSVTGPAGVGKTRVAYAAADAAARDPRWRVLRVPLAALADWRLVAGVFDAGDSASPSAETRAWSGERAGRDSLRVREGSTVSAS
jgi:predicted ATPase